MPPQKKTALQHVTCANLSHLSIDHIFRNNSHLHWSYLNPNNELFSGNLSKLPCIGWLGVFLHPQSDMIMMCKLSPNLMVFHLFILMCYLHGTLDEHRLMGVPAGEITFFDTWKFKVMQMEAIKIRLVKGFGPHNEDFRFSSGMIPLP